MVLARLTAVYTKRPATLVIVGAAIIADGRVLACERSTPPETAGKWEFPGGKVEEGETDQEALIRECIEELGVHVEPGGQVGEDTMLPDGRALLRVYIVRLRHGEFPQLLEHAQLRWLAASELFSVPWLPADAAIVAALPAVLGAETPE